MNILLMNGLPEEYEGIPISADFRNMIQVDLILHDDDLNEIEKTAAALNQLYEEPPKDTHKAAKGLEWFFSRGETETVGKSKGIEKAAKKGYDFEQDANLIYSAFYSTYNISLTTVDFLHWWEFLALFEGLPEETMIKRVIYWRTADLSELPKSEKKHVLKMRKLFALKSTDKEPLSVEEINQQTLDRAEQRYKQAQEALEKSVK